MSRCSLLRAGLHANRPVESGLQAGLTGGEMGPGPAPCGPAILQLPGTGRQQDWRERFGSFRSAGTEIWCGGN